MPLELEVKKQKLEIAKTIKIGSTVFVVVFGISAAISTIIGLHVVAGVLAFLATTATVTGFAGKTIEDQLKIEIEKIIREEEDEKEKERERDIIEKTKKVEKRTGYHFTDSNYLIITENSQKIKPKINQNPEETQIPEERGSLERRMKKITTKPSFLRKRMSNFVKKEEGNRETSYQLK